MEPENSGNVDELVILDGPVTDNVPVKGFCEGRMVAYWPSDQDEAKGLVAVGGGKYIPAVIVAAWNSRKPVSMPCANIKLLFNGNIPTAAKESLTIGGNSDTLGSKLFSLKPAKGCFTWIPQA